MWSERSDAVTPENLAFVITGPRVNGRGESRIEISGTTAGMGMGAELTPWWRKLGSGKSFRAADAILLDAEGTFTWSRAASESRTWRVYVTSGDVRSNTLRIR